MFSGFSWEPDYIDIPSFKNSRYCQVRLKRWICLPLSISTPFNELFRQFARLSLLRLHITHYTSTGILTCSSIGLAIRLNLRPRLTLIRLTLFRKPWVFGVQVSRLHYRYLCLHFLFQSLQHTSQYTFSAGWNAPLPLLQSP